MEPYIHIHTWNLTYIVVVVVVVVVEVRIDSSDQISRDVSAKLEVHSFNQQFGVLPLWNALPDHVAKAPYLNSFKYETGHAKQRIE